MIHIQRASLAYGSQVIFNDIALTFAQNQRIGVLGRNGAGKSTLLKIIAGHAHFDEGKVTLDRHRKIVYMPQEMVLLSDKSVFDEAFSVFEALLIQEKEKAVLEEALAQGTASAQLYERYAEIHNEQFEVDSADARARTEKILKGLGFSRLMFQQQVSELSVGWKMRLVLAKLLLEQADFYLFDEPTNHLDLPTKEWFFDFLKESRFGFLLVSHDRHFLENGCEYILALERGKALFFHGNLSAYIAAAEQAQIVLHSAHARQQKEIARKQATIERFRASASKARMAQSMIKQLEKIERIEIEPVLPTVSFSFPPATRSGAVVLTLVHVAHTFDKHTLFKNVNGTIARGDRIALIAANGTGKSTLFNLIAGKLRLLEGTITFGTNVQYALFEQDQMQSLNPKNTVYEELLQALPAVNEATIRTFLGCFLFSGEAIRKKIEVLSGGERNRVAMVKVLLQKANFLLLDEPTNHLDLYAKEVLLNALKQYQGTILFVSHDHAFIQELATSIWELTPSGIVHFPGTYEEYLYTKKQTELAQTNTTSQQPSVTVSPVQSNKENYGRHKEIAALESKIARCEKDIEKLVKIFGETEYGSPQWIEAETKHEAAKKLLAELTAQWEREMLS